MITVIITLLPVFGIIVLGMVIERCRLMPAGTAACLNQFVYWIGLPSLLFNQIARVEPQQLTDAYMGGIILSMLVAYTVTYMFFSKGFLQRKPENTIMTMLATFPNSAFMGLPIVFLLLPGNQAAAVAASLAAVVNTLVLIMADASLNLKNHGKTSKHKALFQMIRALSHNPLLVASAAGALLACTGFSPAPLVTMSGLLGATASPCALFCLGMILSVQLTSTRSVRKGWLLHQLPVHLVKLALLPGITYVCLALLPVSDIALATGVLISAMPTGIASYVIAEKYGLCAEEASLCIVVNTGLSVLSIPVLVRVLQQLALL